MQVLAMLQREGRLIDFLEDNVAGYSDAEVGAAARVVHEGCRRALRACAVIEPIRGEEEGQPLAVPEGFDAGQIKLTGNLKGSGPYRGVLRHKGWRASKVTLPTLLAGADPGVLNPAEVEL